MLGVTLAQTADETRLVVLVIALVLVAFLLTALTVWYWKYTDPNKAMTHAERRRRNPVAVKKSVPSRDLVVSNLSASDSNVDLAIQKNRAPRAKPRSSLDNRVKK